jgi:PHD/YefM family antitoxin component YafN of YafNO toxin-antitoxin module
MSKSENIQETMKWPSALIADLSQPIVLEQGGQPMAVLMSIEEYRYYQTLLAQQKQISALEARRAADRAVFGDLVGCALNSGEPIWVPAPKPHWRVPYRLFDGTLLTIVEVDGYIGTVSLTNEERTNLLEQVERLAVAADAHT